MKQIKIDGKEMKITVSPYSLVLYEREFEKDLVEDAMELVQGFSSGKIKGNIMLKMIWVMAKTAKMQDQVKIFPSFEDWMIALGSIDLSNREVIDEVTGLINDRLFRENEEESQSSESENE